MSSVARRGLLGGAAAILAGAGVASTPATALPNAVGLDADLLALCAEFRRHDQILQAWDAGAVGEDVGAQAHRLWWSVVDALQPIQPQTMAGVREKAWVAWRTFEAASDSNGRADDFCHAVLAQIAGNRAAPTATADEELITLSDRYVSVWREWRDLAAADHDAPDRGPNHARWSFLADEMTVLEDRIETMDAPTTSAGMRALARVALADCPRDLDNNLTCNDFTDWVRVSVCEAAAGGDVL